MFRKLTSTAIIAVALMQALGCGEEMALVPPDPNAENQTGTNPIATTPGQSNGNTDTRDDVSLTAEVEETARLRKEREDAAKLAVEIQIALAKGEWREAERLDFYNEDVQALRASLSNAILGPSKRFGDNEHGIYDIEIGGNNNLLAYVGDFKFEILDLSNGKAIITEDFGRYRKGHFLAVSPDGRTLAIIGGSGVDFLDFATGNSIPEKGGFLWEPGSRPSFDSVNCATYSPDGKMLAYSRYFDYGDPQITVLDVENGKVIRTFKEEGYKILSIDFSPDGNRIISGSNAKKNKSGNSESRISVWDVSTGENLATIRQAEYGIDSVAFNPDGSTFATTFHNKVRIWNAKTYRKERELTHNESNFDHCYCLAYSPDGRLLATATGNQGNFLIIYSRTIKLWDSETGALLKTLDGIPNDEMFNTVTFSANGKRLASGSEFVGDGGDDVKRITIWNLDFSEYLTTIDRVREKYRK